MDLPPDVEVTGKIHWCFGAHHPIVMGRCCVTLQILPSNSTDALLFIRKVLGI